MTDQEIVSIYKKVCELEKEISEIQVVRRNAELELTVEYKVEECNRKRNELALNFQQQINERLAQIKSIKDQVGTKCDGV